MIRIWRLNREQILKRLSDWAQTLVSNPEVLGVILFGSLVRGNCTAASDADLLVVLRHSDLRFHDRIPLYRPRGIGIPVDVFPYTLAEALQSRDEGWGIVRSALTEGQVLYDAGASLEGLFRPLELG